MMRKSTVVREKSLRTQERILEAAERLFADKGFSGASMRDITSLAKVNLSVAYYYFKDKEALLFAVFDRYVKPLMDKQLEMLERARKEAGTSPITPRRLLEAMILPRTESVSEVVHQLFTMLLARRGVFEQRVFESIENATKEIREKFFTEFSKTFPLLPSEEVRFRIESVHAMLAGWTAIAPFKKGTYPKDITREDLFEMFMAMVLEMFGAPPTLSRKA
ncbi:MAG: TetR/AcrR family transcriptional regulator [Verrucomicrobia bacterium]|nr:TetR/AcrR family transcriptional regulator [Verrucomicrobiota bacterium]